MARRGADRDTTVLLLNDLSAESSDMQMQSIAHGLIRLNKVLRSYGVNRRQVEILELRGSSFREGFIITPSRPAQGNPQ